jgi:hypothetical protein
MLGQQTVGIAQIAKETGLTRQTEYRIKDDPASAETALTCCTVHGEPTLILFTKPKPVERWAIRAEGPEGLVAGGAG